MGGLVIVQPLTRAYWVGALPTPPASPIPATPRSAREGACVRLYSQPVWPSTPVKVIRQVSVPAYFTTPFPTTPRPEFQPPPRVPEADSPRNTIAPETPVKIRLAPRKKPGLASTESLPTLLRRGPEKEKVKEIRVERQASSRPERLKLEERQREQNEAWRRQSEQRRESLAEDLRRLAEEKRRVRREEAEEVERKREEAQRARQEAASRRLHRKLLLVEEKHRLAEEARRAIEEGRRRRFSEPGKKPEEPRGRRKSGVERRRQKGVQGRSKSADATHEAERCKAEEERLQRLRQEEEEAERRRVRREELQRLAEESKRRIAGCGVAWHAVLNVDAAATLAQVKQAFRDLALLHHPDKGLESCNETFRIVRGAYQRALAFFQEKEAKAST